MRRLSAILCCGLLALSAACTKDAVDATDSDGNTDTGPNLQEELCADYPDNIACPTLPAPPQLEDGTDFSEWEPSQCPAGAMPDFGKPGCIVIGDPCPEGDWPEDLPTDNIRYVTPGGTGDGRTKETAAGSIQQMLSGTTSGTMIALSKGTFREAIEVAADQHIVGTCARQTRLEGPTGSTWSDSTVFFRRADDASLKNVTISGRRMGINVFENTSAVHVTGVMIESAKAYGLFVQSGVAEVEALVVERTAAKDDGRAGEGVRAQLGSTLRVAGAYLFENRSVGLGVASDGSILIADQVLIAKTQSLADGSLGRAVEVKGGAELQLTRAFLIENMGAGIAVGESGSEARVSHSVIRESGRDGVDGRGVNVQLGASLSLSHSVVTGNRYVGVSAEGEGTEVDVSDLVIEATQPNAGGEGGTGLTAQKGARVALSRVRIQSNTRLGILGLGQETTLLASDLVVKDTQSDAAGLLGRGIVLQSGAELELSRALLDANREVGLYLAAEGTSVGATDLVIRNTDAAACEASAELTCPGAGGGWGDGILALGPVALSLQDFALFDNARVAAHFYAVDASTETDVVGLSGGPTVAAENGLITDNPYGINIRGSSVVPSDFTLVACYDNASTVDGCYSEVQLEVPSVTDALTGVAR